MALDEFSAEPLSPSAEEVFILGNATTRRRFLLQVTAALAALALGPRFLKLAQAATVEAAKTADAAAVGTLHLKINGKAFALEQLDPRITLLDLLREHLQLTG